MDTLPLTNDNVIYSRISTRRKNVEAEEFPAISLANRITASNVEPRIVGIRSAFRGSTFFRIMEIRLKQ